jgi:hypothetical protein
VQVAPPKVPSGGRIVASPPPIRDDCRMTDQLREISQAEVAAEGHLQGLGSYAESDWHEFMTWVHLIHDYLSLADAGEPPPEDVWRDGLHQLGEARRQFANNADVVIRQHIEARKAHLAGAQHDLTAVIAALEDVQGAIHDAAEAEHLTHLVLKLKDLAEFAHEPTLGHAWHVVHGEKADSLIEQGIGNLAQYQVLTTLASHGFASVEELHRRVAGATAQVTEAAEALHTELQMHEEARKYAEWPAFS